MNATLRCLTFMCVLGLATACSDASTKSTAADGSAGGGKTDEAGANDLINALEGRQDVVASYLRVNADDQGMVSGDYEEVLAGVAEAMGCDIDSARTFVILLTRAGFFPRNIMTLCADDPAKASTFFLSTQSDNSLDDVDPQNIKLAAWDDSARRYRLYELTPQDGAMKLNIDPGQCQTCHAGSADLDNSNMPFIPIMNELVNPWTLWNAEPEFRSHQYEDTIDPELQSAPVFSKMTSEDRLDSAANFEIQTRAAFDRITNARLRTRRDGPDLAESLALLRPLFCDETLNYVSENHDTGETHASIVIDDAIRRLFLTIRPDNWPWDWLNDGVLRLTLPEEGEVPLSVMPVRGEATLQIEVSLVTRRVLTAHQVLQVRALDWKNPVMSQFRCDLFQNAEARLYASPPELVAYPRNADLIPALYDEIMQLTIDDPISGETRTVPLSSGEDGILIAIEDVLEVEAAYMLASTGDFASFVVSLEGFGEQLETYFQSLQTTGQRALLNEERIRRGCIANSVYPSAPLIPGVADACQ